MSRSDSSPVPLPRRLLPDLIRREPLLLCVDYDGTLAAIVSDPKQAWPIERSRTALIALARHPARAAVAVVSGRDLGEIRRLLRVDRGFYLVGVHGLEMAGPGGEPLAAGPGPECAAELDRLRQWSAREIPGGRGLMVEDKGLSLALHYRNADPERARGVIAQFERLVAADLPHLMLKRGKMVVEAVPRQADKGRAVATLIARLKTSGRDYQPVYFGDDLTDEDAFRALGGRGVTIKVGAGPSAAQYRLEGPQAVADTLADLAASVESDDSPRASGSGSGESCG